MIVNGFASATEPQHDAFKYTSSLVHLQSQPDMRQEAHYCTTKGSAVT